MINESLITYTHYLSFFILLASLWAEYINLSSKIQNQKANIIAKADGFFGLSSILVLATGFWRMYTLKGTEYYFSNTFFLIKLGLFIVVGLLSIYPTIVFIKWRKQIKEGEDIQLTAEKYRLIKGIIILELVLVFLIPLFAALMARGV